ncbi:MAG: ECF transporter S component [Candidatus Bathyarchaeia archaeon]
MAFMKGKLTTLKISITAIFTALVCAATIVFSIYVPATRGYFNIGESMVYTTALLFGPYIGAFAGGVGSMLADMLLGYWIYAPATLIIKACEGAIVGFLSQKSFELKSRMLWRGFTFSTGAIVGIIIGYIGTTYYAGYAETSIGLPITGYTVLSISIPYAFWLTLAIIVALLISSLGFLYDPQLGWFIASVLAGGCSMVLGYFIYEWFLFGTAALVEVPVNIGQLTVGLIVSIPLTKAILRIMPFLQKEV